MSLNQSMNIATGSLKNNQYALTVVSHNIANVNTEGYIRQRVNFQEDRLYADQNNVLRTIKGLNGAKISQLTNFVDKGALDDTIRTNSDANYYNTLADNLSGLEDIVDALGDDGLNSLLNDFFKASSNLEQYPTDISIRQQFATSAESICDKFNDLAKKIDIKEEETIEDTNNAVGALNSLFEKLADANSEYIKSGKSDAAKNNINSILQEISGYTDVTYSTNSNGTVNLYIGNTTVVQAGKQNYTLESKMENGKYSLYLQSTDDPNYKLTNGITEAFSSGKMKAQLDFLNGDSTYTLSSLRDKLDDLANTFATELNKIQTYSDGDTFAASITTDGNGNLLLEKSTENLFSTSDGSTKFSASNISINSKIKKDPWLLAAARIDSTQYTGDSWKNAVGNSSNATEITDLQNKKVCSYAKNSDTTFSKFLSSLATDIGSNVDSIKAKADNAQDLADSSMTTFTNLIGVNLDEELADMIKYQRSYEASAKLFSTVNNLYDTILSMV